MRPAGALPGAGQLDRFCVPWMPSATTLRLLGRITPFRSLTQRLSRRQFPPHAQSRKVQGQVAEMRRLLLRGLGRDDDRLANEANDWLMRAMARECQRSGVTAINAYEVCSLRQFVKAKRLSKACIYDLPIGYYSAWDRIRTSLAQKYTDWLSADSLSVQVRREQKCKRRSNWLIWCWCRASLSPTPSASFIPTSRSCACPLRRGFGGLAGGAGTRPWGCHHISVRRAMFGSQGSSALARGLASGRSEARPSASCWALAIGGSKEEGITPEVRMDRPSLESAAASLLP